MSTEILKRVKDLKLGEYFVLTVKLNSYAKESEVWIRGHFDRSSKTYSCYKFSDVNHERFFKGSKLVCVDFTF